MILKKTKTKVKIPIKRAIKKNIDKYSLQRFLLSIFHKDKIGVIFRKNPSCYNIYNYPLLYLNFLEDRIVCEQAPISDLSLESISDK